MRNKSHTTLIKNANVIDVDAGITLWSQDVLIRDGRIADISRLIACNPAQLIDAGGAYLFPGLIDCHVHLFLDGGDSPRLSFLEATDEMKLLTAQKNASQAIHAGVTTVRDCGGPQHLVFGFQQSIAWGDMAGPRIIACGSPLTRPQGHCHFFGIEVSMATQIRRAIEVQLYQGASFVKLIASGGGLTPGTQPGEADLPLDLMREATDVAHANGVHVSAHCHATASIVRALEAGVDIVEHASFIDIYGNPSFDQEIAARVEAQGTVISPTVISGLRTASAIRKSGTQNGLDHNAVARLESRREHAARFHEGGARIIAGTDCGVTHTPFDSLVDELSAYVDAGMSRIFALRSATSESARYLQQPSLGQIKPGYHADLLMLSANPLQELGTLRNPLAVLKSGEIVCDYRTVPAGIA